MKPILKYIAILIVTGITLLNFWPEKALDSSKQIDKILVLKSDRKLILFSKGEEIKRYKISLGGNPIGHKEYEGDMKTPEGNYTINDKNPNSGYHLNLGIDYPNKQDVQHAKELGKSPGGDIKIHGLRNGMGFIGKIHRFFDWTAGCIAMTNKEIKELYDNVPIGTPIEIRK